MTDKSYERIEEFYAQVQELTTLLKKHQINIIGDFNAKIGKGKVNDNIRMSSPIL